MERKESILLSVLLLSVLTTPGVVRAETRATSPPAASGLQAKEHEQFSIYKEAGVTQEQLEKIHQMTKEAEDKLSADRQNLISQHAKMRDLFLQQDPDEKAVLAQQEEISKTYKDMAMD